MKTNCQSIRSELSAYLDDELPPARRTVVEKHLSDCPRCRGELENLKSLVAGVTALPRLEPPPRFLAEVRRKIAREEKSHWKVWQDYLFRPFWLKIPLETVAVLVVVAIMMRVERSPSERSLKYEARKEMGQEPVTTLAANESQSRAWQAPRDLAGSAPDEKLRSLTPSAPVAVAQSAPAAELQRAEPATVIVVRANDFKDVQSRVQQIVIPMNARFVSPPNREATARTIFVELPETDVALFKARLLQATESTRAADEHLLAAQSGTAPRIASSSTTTMGIGPNVLTGKVGTNLIAVGGSERLHAAAESKPATVVLEIQVVPPPN